MVHWYLQINGFGVLVYWSPWNKAAWIQHSFSITTRSHSIYFSFIPYYHHHQKSHYSFITFISGVDLVIIHCVSKNQSGEGAVNVSVDVFGT